MSKTLLLTQLGDTKTLAINSGIGPTGATGPAGADGADGADGGLATVQSSSFTAENDKIYHVVASASVTDPTPTEGKGYTVFVRNGTATVGGTGYTATATYNPYIIRTFHSGSWKTVVYQDKAAADAAYAAASHTHVSSAITDATDDGDTNPEKILKTDPFGQVKAYGVYSDLSGGIGLMAGDPSGAVGNFAVIAGTNITGARTYQAPNESGTLALTSQTDGSITAADVSGVPATDPSGVTGADAVTNIISLTQAEYDAIGTPNASTLYVITS